MWLSLLLVVVVRAGQVSEFWSSVLPLACKSSCERYFREHDEPNKDCVAFCAPLAKQLLENEEVQKALAQSSAAYGLNLAQWAMRDVVMSRGEKQPVEIAPFVFVSRMEYYEHELTKSQDPEVRRAAFKVAKAQRPADEDEATANAHAAAASSDIAPPVNSDATVSVKLPPREGSAFVDEL